MPEIDVAQDVLTSLGYRLHPIPRKLGMFVKGPLPVGWLLRVDVTTHTAALALVIKALIDATGFEPVVVPTVIWQRWGLTKLQKKRALDALERAGIIRIERTPGKVTRIWLIDKP